MKTFLLLPLVLAAPVFAGTSAKQVVTPPPDNCATTWFAGASVGYLTQLDEPFYTVHVGLTNTCWNPGGFNISLFAEVGYTEKDSNATYHYTSQDYRHTVKFEEELTIVPVTLNVKFEHQIVGGLSAYFGGGLGMAWINMDESITDTSLQSKKHVSASDSDWVFCAQIFAGLGYNVNPHFEIYAGGRWIYLADPTLFGSKQSINDDWLIELGTRFKF